MTDIAPDAVREFAATWPIELVRVLAPLRRGGADPCHVVVGDRDVWRTTCTCDGPVVAHLRQESSHRVSCRAWGPGAEAFAGSVDELLGARDEPEAFAPRHELLAKLHRAHPWLRVPRTGRVFEAMASAVLEQRVTVAEAFRGRTALIRWHGAAPVASPAGMPASLRMLPTPSEWAKVPSWDWHRAGVDVHRAATLTRAAHVATRLDECADMTKLEALRRMRAVPGIGVWTVAEVRQRALGDADAVSFGDTHLARFVGYALLGHSIDDHQLHELLEPWRGHRFRVIRLLQLGVAHGVVRTAPRIARPRERAHLGY